MEEARQSTFIGCIMSSVADKSPNKGHRQRLKRRFMNSGFRTLDDYEILEMLLFYVHPRRDTKQIAKKLLNDYGSLKKLILQDNRDLLQSDLSEGVKYQIKLLQELMSRVVVEKDGDETTHTLNNWNEVLHYLKIDLGYCEREYFKVLFLNTRNFLIGERNYDSGTVNRAVVFPREIVKGALNNNAAAVILVHNHPSGDPAPSANDLRTTKMIKNALNTVDISLHDHIIVAHDNYYSMRNHSILG